MMNKKSKFYLALVIFSLVGQIAWVIENMYFNVFIYKMFNASAEDISLMVALSAVTATATTIFIGALSDKIGKRKVFMCGGYVIWGITILAFAGIRLDIISSLFGATISATSIAITLVIIMDCVMTFFGSSANDACFNAWLTESVDQSERGKAEGINSMMPLVAILVVFGGFMFFDQNLASSWTAIFIIIGVIVLAIGVLGLFIIDESAVKTEENTGYFKNIFYGFRLSVIKENFVLYVCLILFALFGISFQIIMPYIIIYYEKTLEMANYVFVFAPAIVIASVFTFFYGRVYDKKGFKFSAVPALILLSVGYLSLFIFKSTPLVFIGTTLMMSGNLAGGAVFGAVVRDNIPQNKAGMFQGLRIIGQVLIPGVIGPSIGSAVLKNATKIPSGDGTPVFLPNANIFLASFIVSIVLIALLFLSFILIKNFKKEEQTEEVTK